MILAMGRDIRVVVIKLADRLHNMLTLGYLSKINVIYIARNARNISPIAIGLVYILLNRA